MRPATRTGTRFCSKLLRSLVGVIGENLRDRVGVVVAVRISPLPKRFDLLQFLTP